MQTHNLLLLLIRGSGMICLYCQRKIGLFGRLTDNEYCSKEHRVLMRAQSAREIRNNPDYDLFEAYDDDSTVFVKPIHGLTVESAQISIEHDLDRHLRAVAGRWCLRRDVGRFGRAA